MPLTLIKCTLRLFGVFCIGTLIIGTILYMFRMPILVNLAQFLTINDPLEPADAIYVLGGDFATRPAHAAALYKQGLAPKIILPKEETGRVVEMGLYPHNTEVAIKILTEMGVDEANIIVLTEPGEATSTFDEVEMLRLYMTQEKLEKIIIVTTAFHTRRARWIFRRGLKTVPVTLLMSPAEHAKFNEQNWWQVELGLIRYFEEYLKFAYYLYRY